VRTCSATSPNQSLTPKTSRSQRPVSSTRTLNPVWRNVPIWWLSMSNLTPSKLCSRPSTFRVTREPLRKPTCPPPLRSARCEGNTVMSNHSVRQTDHLVLFAPSSTRKWNTVAPILHAPLGVTSKPYPTTAWPLLRPAQTARNCTQPEAGTALNAHLLPRHETLLKPKKPSCCRP